MDKIVSILGEIVIALGGAGAVIIALSSFIGKQWSDRYMKKKTAEYDKQIEFYKNSLELERDRYNALYEQIVYKNKIIFDYEYDVYKDILPKMIKAKKSFDLWITFHLDDDKLYKYKEDQNLLNDTISSYSVFIDKEIYDKINSFSENIGHLAFEIAELNSDKYSVLKGKYDSEALDILLELSSKQEEITVQADSIIDYLRDYIRDKAKIM